MPQLELTDHELIVRMGQWEQMMALSADVHVPLTQVRSAIQNDGYGGPSGFKLGLRLPGTHVPFVVAAGTFLKSGDRQFVFTRRTLHTVVIELTGNEWTRLVIGVPDAHAAAARINAALARLGTNAG
jgi:hypothetical protein